MTATQFVSIANQIIFAVILAVTVARAIRLRTVPSFDIALFFGLIVGTQQLGNLFDLLGMGDSPVASRIAPVVVPWLPYLLLRITDHFAPQRGALMLAALAVTVAVTTIGLVSPVPMPNLVALIVVAWFVVGGGWASLALVREASRAPGVTARRLTASAAGSALLAVALVLAMAGLLVPAVAELGGIATQLLVTAGGVAYYAGFATPTWLRRTWQEPSVRSFLAHSPELVQEPDETRMVDRLQQFAAEAMGVPTAAVGLLSSDGTALRWIGPDGQVVETPSDRWIAGRALASGHALFSRNPAQDDPEHGAEYRQEEIAALMAAPMQVGDRRYGVLVVYGARPPLFAYSDLDLTAVLAQQAAGILESRELLRDAAEVRAREVATRAKEDFLSAAAHDLRTPLSSMVLRAELLKKRLEQDGSPHLAAVEAVITDASRVTEFVEDLLDAARAEQGRLSTAREPVDLAELAQRCATAMPAGEHELVLGVAEAPVVGDERRLTQVIDNLLSNARKYSPEGGPIELEVASVDGMARVRVRDRGIGIAREDLPNLFERFNRGRNVDDRRFSGLGLGLYICRRIVEEHGGRIWAESEVGVGTTMQFELPSAERAQREADG